MLTGALPWSSLLRFLVVLCHANGKHNHGNIGIGERRIQAARDELCSLQKWFGVRIEMHYDEHVRVPFLPVNRGEVKQ
jgi:hypothetical protein